MSALPLQTQRSIEADTFWCMSKLLDGIQVDGHTHTYTEGEGGLFLTPVCSGQLHLCSAWDPEQGEGFGGAGQQDRRSVPSASGVPGFRVDRLRPGLL